MKKEYREIFRKGSKTYFHSCLFFPKKVRDEVSILYVFVRKIDDLVDSVPQKKAEFYRQWKLFNKKQITGIDYLDDFKKLVAKTKIDKEWVEAFWKSMELDLIKKVYQSLEELEEYMYGSAEVIGLMMAKIMKLPKSADETARKLGKAMQYANFIRDVDEDQKMGRNYLGVKDKDDFVKRLAVLKNRFFQWQSEAEVGYRYLPKRYLIPIKTAAEMYKWTIETIGKNPAIVFEKKVKPGRERIMVTGLLIGLTT